jgi:hypothetical protein
MTRHDRSRSLIAATLVTVACVGWMLASAQPPEGRDGPPPPPPGRGDAIRTALDVNGDHELDADEIKNAAANLAKADRNGDGRIDHEEFRPAFPPPMPRGEGGFRGPPPRDGEFRGPPPREGEFRGPPPRPGEEGRPPREGPPREGPPREGPPREGPPREGPPPREAGSPGERRPPPEGGPSPERFVERAMTFDADGDGKLDRAELEKFAGEFMQRLQGGMPGRGPGERPERPRRPE